MAVFLYRTKQRGGTDNAGRRFFHVVLPGHPRPAAECRDCSDPSNYCEPLVDYMSRSLYKCRCTQRTKKWIDIYAEDSEEAAALYAEDCHLDSMDIVTVENHGRYEVYREVTYAVNPTTKKA